MIATIVSGSLAVDPVERQTREEKPLVTAILRMPAGEEAAFPGVAAFEPTAPQWFSQFREGGAVSACSVLENNNWVTQAGEAHIGWWLAASEVLTAYGATKKRRTAQGHGDA